MRTICVVAGLVVVGSTPAGAAGTITDQAVSLTYSASHWGEAPSADLQGTEPTASLDSLNQVGWFYRAQGETREHALPAPDQETYADGQLTAVWNDLDGKGFYVIEVTRVLDGEGPSGGLLSLLTVHNSNAEPRSFDLFHYANPNVAGTSGNDVAALLRTNYLQLGDGAEPTARLRYRAPWAQHFKLGTAAAVRGLLVDSDVDDLDDTAVLFGPGDVGAAFQFTLVIPANGSLVAPVSLLSRQSRHYVKGAAFDLTPWPALYAEDGPVDQVIGMRRTAAMGLSGGYVHAANWSIVGADDFDYDYVTDVVRRNTVTAALQVNGVPLAGAAPPPLNWTLGATGDWNDDGMADLFWRNTTSQKLVVWFMNGATKIGSAVPTPDQAAHANWGLAGGADFNGDGFRDILWYNQTSGNLVIWYLDANLVRITGAFTSPSSVGNNNWSVVSVGDYGKGTGPGALWNTPDIVWQNASSKKLVVWHMDLAGQRTSGTFTSPDNLNNLTVIGPR